jgi:hypothetical protein
MNDANTIGTNGVGSLFATGTAYVAIPADLDRALFIKRCYSTQTLFIRGEAGETFKNVFCPKSIIQDIVFPATADKRGSMVAWVKQPKHNSPVVVAAFDLKNGLGAVYKERQIKLQKTSTSGNLVDFDAQADEATMDITVTSAEEGKGKFRLKVVNPDVTAAMEVYVSGEVDILADSKVSLRTTGEILVELLKANGDLLANFSYKAGVGFALKDEFDNEIKTTDQQIYLKEGSVGGLELELTNTILNLGKIGGSGTEPVLKGDKSVDVLNDIKGMLQDIATNLATIATADTATASGLGLSYGGTFATLATNLGISIATLTAHIALVKSTKVKTL